MANGNDRLIFNLKKLMLIQKIRNYCINKEC